jgi:predicted peptidase
MMGASMPMKVACQACLVLAIIFSVGCGVPGGGRPPVDGALPPGRHRQAFEDRINKTVGCEYWLFLPAGYGKVRQEWPVILFLDGSSCCGDDLEQVKSFPTSDALSPPAKMVKDVESFPFLVVSPQYCDEFGQADLDAPLALLDYIISHFDVDPERVYLTGLSMGGFGSWALGCRHPERFAAIAPLCGGGSTAKACNLKNVPVWAFHGAQDKFVPVSRSEEMVNAVKACGGDARLTVYPEVGHKVWKVAYKDQELYDWFLRHRKSSKGE